ncbi:MAG TPA: hypothetical protein VFA95_02435 [Gammaproteobacteria bacterium]|nr:hypothetical protein [Gammaproteobacteria bacterium]
MPAAEKDFFEATRAGLVETVPASADPGGVPAGCSPHPHAPGHTPIPLDGSCDAQRGPDPSAAGNRPDGDPG